MSEDDIRQIGQEMMARRRRVWGREGSSETCTSRAHVLGVWQVLPRRWLALRQWHHSDDASLRALWRRLAGQFRSWRDDNECRHATTSRSQCT